MSPSEAAYWQRAHRRVASLSPDMAVAVLRAFQYVRDSLSEAELARLIASGDIDALVLRAITDAILYRAFAPVQTRIRTTVERGFQFTAPSLPKSGQLLVQFDVLNPNVIRAIRTLETRGITALKSEIRETVRAFVENGLRDGVNPRTIARNLRSVIGMSPTQEKNAQKFEAKLRADPKNTAESIAKQVATYRKRAIALNAETNARTATLDAFKVGQRLSWQDAIAKGVVERDRLKRQWIGVNDERERPSHVAMNDQVQPFDVPYTNGQMVPGESEYNCRCIEKFFIGRAA